MIIVSGHIVVRHGRRDDFLASSTPAVVLARKSRGCLDFIVAPDPIEPDRVNVYEAWASEADLLAFRGEGPGADLMSLIESAKVQRYQIASSGPA